MDESEKIMIQSNTVGMLTCIRCGHTWLPRKIGKKPKVCPSPTCHSPYFDEPRVRPVRPKIEVDKPETEE